MDFSEYGVFRRGPCDHLAVQAMNAFAEPAVARSEMGTHASLLAIYLFAGKLVYEGLVTVLSKTSISRTGWRSLVDGTEVGSEGLSSGKGARPSARNVRAVEADR